MQVKSKARVLLVMMIGLLAVLVLGTTVSANGYPTNIPKVTDIQLKFDSDMRFTIENDAANPDPSVKYLVDINQNNFGSPLNVDQNGGVASIGDYTFVNGDEFISGEPLAESTYFVTIYATKEYVNGNNSYYVNSEPTKFIIAVADSQSSFEVSETSIDYHLYYRNFDTIVIIPKEETTKLVGKEVKVERQTQYPTLIQPLENTSGVLPYSLKVSAPETDFTYNASVNINSTANYALPAPYPNALFKVFKDSTGENNWTPLSTLYPVIDGSLTVKGVQSGDRMIAGYDVEADTHYVTSILDDDTPGTLRHAILHANDGDTIEVNVPARSTINLLEPLTIYDNIHIKGNGVTINGSVVAFGETQEDTPSIYITPTAQVRIENVKFYKLQARNFYESHQVIPSIQQQGFTTLVNVVIGDFERVNGASPVAISHRGLLVGAPGTPMKTVLFNTTIADVDDGYAFNDYYYYYGNYMTSEFYNSIIEGDYNTYVSEAENNIFAGYTLTSLDHDNTNIFTRSIPFENTGAEPYRTVSTFADARDNGGNMYRAATKDILGNDRIRNNTIDRGAYELAPLGGGGTTPPPVGPTVPADGGADGTPSVQIPINRVANGDGTFSDTVTMTSQQASELIQRLREANRSTVRIVLPDADDTVANARVNISRAILAQFAEADFSLEITTNDGRVIVPNSSLLDFDEDLYFLFRPVKDQEGKLEVENRAKSDELVTENVGSPDTLFVVGRPMTIETNMQERLVELEFPVPTGDVPTDGTRTLKMFIEHSDGTKELKDVEVFDRNGQTYIRFTTEKFSTFTVLNVEVLDDPVTPVEPGFHESYIRGFDDGTFRPSASITRVQVAAMLARNLGFDDAPGTSGFTDVPATHWASGSVGFLKAEGIFGGYSDDTFRPNEPITRGELAAVIARYKGVGGGKSSFTDVSGYWGAGDIAAIQELGIIQGYSDGTFRPRANITRAEAVTMLNRTFERGPLYGVTTPSWPDVPATHWAFEEVEEASRDHSFLPREGGGEMIVVE